jgi:hypothetical protein
MKKFILIATFLMLGVGCALADATTPNYFYVGENGVLDASDGINFYIFQQ